MLPLLALMTCPTALALPQATCLSCLDGGDDSRELLYRASRSEPLVLEWRGSWPDVGRDHIRLYLGNPSLSAALADRGLAPAQGPLRVELAPAEVGRGTLIAVLVREKPNGKAEEILSWEVFRLLDPETQAAQLSGPAPHADWELDLTPSVLRAIRAGQPLPRTQGEQTVWWSLVDQPLDDLDLDGASTGLPGLSVTVSQPWRRREEGWQDAVRAVLGADDGHQVRYGELSWTERPDVPVDDASKERIAYYYAAITMHTNAGFHRYENKEMLVGLGLGEGGRFSHETSANLASPDDPRLWSGYSVRELSEDPRLLSLLADQVSDGRPVPGLPTGLGRTDGDGGRPTWELGFTTRIQRWEQVAGKPDGKAAIKAIDVVATRNGIAAPRVQGADEPGIVAKLERALGGDGTDPLSFGDLPEGWRLALPVADPNTRVGSLQLSRGKPTLAQRVGTPLPVNALYQLGQLAQSGALPSVAVESVKPTPPPADPQGLEAQTRFLVSADLRAGALYRDAPLAGRQREIIPIDAYAQYVVQIAVLLERELVVAQPNVETQPEIGAVIPPPPPRQGLLEKVSGWIGVSPGILTTGLGALGVIAVLVLLHMTGLGKVLSRVAMLVLPKPKDPKS